MQLQHIYRVANVLWNLKRLIAVLQKYTKKSAAEAVDKKMFATGNIETGSSQWSWSSLSYVLLLLHDVSLPWSIDYTEKNMYIRQQAEREFDVWFWSHVMSIRKLTWPESKWVDCLLPSLTTV